MKAVRSTCPLDLKTGHSAAEEGSKGDSGPGGPLTPSSRWKEGLSPEQGDVEVGLKGN